MMNETTADSIILRQNTMLDMGKYVRDLQQRLKLAKEYMVTKSGTIDYSFAGRVDVLTLELEKVTDRLAQLESLRQPLTSEYSDLLQYFKGQARERARDALELVEFCMKEDYWSVPGASRRVKAALSFSKTDKRASVPEFRKATQNLDALFERWDATRPKPTFIEGASPTVRETLQQFKAESVAVCPIEWVRKEGVDPDTSKIVTYYEGVLQWPAGTQHGRSPYGGTGKYRQCEACGHAIRDPYNWVPLMLTDAQKQTFSLYVGRDCARTLFDIDMKGKLALAEAF